VNSFTHPGISAIFTAGKIFSMKRPFFYLSALFLILSLIADSQENVSVKMKDFKKGKDGFSEAWKHVKSGDKYYSAGGAGYALAFDEYVKASGYNDANPELNYKTGVSALFSDNKDKASLYLIKAFDLNGKVAKDILLLTGHALQYHGDFTQASDMLNRYFDSGGKKSDDQTKLANKYIKECINARRIIADTLKISITNGGGNINSPSDDYSEILTSDGTNICFASRRPVAQSGSTGSNDKSDENIWVATIQDDSWGAAQLLSVPLTTKYNEVPLFFSKNSDSLFIYTGYQGGGDIKLSVRKKSEWGAPQSIHPSLNSRYNESSLCISPSGNEIYFVSNRNKDNLGGKDICLIQKDIKGKWLAPSNLGNSINTSFDEESVRLSVTGDTLWFSSKGHDSVGGFDIFYAVRNQSGSWDQVTNAGYPLNTPWDELFYQPSPEEPGTFYFVSNRPGGLGGLDIYKGHYNKPDIAVVESSIGDKVK